MLRTKLLYILVTVIILMIIYEINYKLSYRRVSMKNEKIYLNNTNEIKETPKIIMQSIWDKKLIPQKVYDAIEKYCPGYKHIIYDDEECIKFLEENYGDEIKNKFLSLETGAHKADLFRYCWLYKMGGVWIDIKMVLLKNIDEIFKDNEKLYSVSSGHGFWATLLLSAIGSGAIFQGLIVSPPNNPIFPELINRIMITKNYQLKINYHLMTMHFYEALMKMKKDKYHIFTEKCVKENDKNLADRYGLRCSIYDKDEKIFNTRYPEYPWKQVQN